MSAREARLAQGVFRFARKIGTNERLYALYCIRASVLLRCSSFTPDPVEP